MKERVVATKLSTDVLFVWRQMNKQFKFHN
jgi:hypothetical protein